MMAKSVVVTLDLVGSSRIYNRMYPDSRSCKGNGWWCRISDVDLMTDDDGVGSRWLLLVRTTVIRWRRWWSQRVRTMTVRLFSRPWSVNGDDVAKARSGWFARWWWDCGRMTVRLLTGNGLWQWGCVLWICGLRLVVSGVRWWLWGEGRRLFFFWELREVLHCRRRMQ